MVLSWLIFSALFVGMTTGNCEADKMLQCLAHVSTEAPPTDKVAFDQYCQNASVGLACIKNIPCSKTDAAYDRWRWQFGSFQVVRYLCDTDARQTYLRGWKCYENASKSDDGQRCLASMNDTRSSSLGKQCRGLNTLIPCLYKVTKSQCGEDIAEVVVNIYERVYVVVLPNCTSDFRVQPISSSTTSSPGDGVNTATYTITGAVIGGFVIVSIVVCVVMAMRTTTRSAPPTQRGDAVTVSAARGDYRNLQHYNNNNNNVYGWPGSRYPAAKIPRRQHAYYIC